MLGLCGFVGPACLVLDHNPAMISCRAHLMPSPAAGATWAAALPYGVCRGLSWINKRTQRPAPRAPLHVTRIITKGTCPQSPVSAGRRHRSPLDLSSDLDHRK